MIRGWAVAVFAVGGIDELATLIGEALGVEPVFRTASIESFPFANVFRRVVETAE
jgi:hypothetical protein